MALALLGLVPALRPSAAIAAPASPAAVLAKATIDSLVVRDMRGMRVMRLAPADTFLFDAYVSHPQGFGQLTFVSLKFSYDGRAGSSDLPAELAMFQWMPASTVGAFYRDTGPSSWTILPGLCRADTSLTATDSRLVRFAIVVGQVARATSSGLWTLQLWTDSGVRRDFLGYDMAERIALVGHSASGTFEAAAPGTAGITLTDPASGALRLEVVSNAPWRLLARAHRFVGLQDARDGFDVLAADSTMGWRTPDPGGAGGALDSAMAVLLDAQAPNADEAPLARDPALLLRLPPGLDTQTYAANLDWRVALASGADSVSIAVPLTLTVAGSGFAADTAYAEIAPYTVVAGTVAQSFTVHAWLGMIGSNTGVNRLTAGMPAGFSNVRVTQVAVWGFPVSFADSSRGTSAIAQLSSEIANSSPVAVTFRADVSALADTSHRPVGVVVDDTRTAIGGLVAVPGNPNPFVPSERLDIAVMPGPLATLGLQPAAAGLVAGDTLRFSVQPRDAMGNRLTVAVNWAVSGGIGTIGADGLFQALAPGSGRVIAASGAAAETATVTVTAATSGIEVAELVLAPGVATPGGAPFDMLRFRVRNTSGTTQVLDGLGVVNASTGPGSVAELDADWLPLTLASGRAGTSPAVSSETAAFSGGSASFARLGLAIAGGDSLDISIRGGASLRARDGDRLRVKLADRDAVQFEGPVQTEGRWPLVTSPSRRVDGMSAAQVGLESPVAAVSVGARRQPVLAVDLPPNGYRPDTLLRVNLLQLGDALPGSDLETLELWMDDGDGVFDAADLPLGVLPWTGARWERTGLAVPVPVSGRRLIVTADVAETAIPGRTLRLALPSLPDVALVMASDNSGPIDAMLAAPGDVVLSVADRMMLAALPLPGQAVAPGTRDVPLLAAELRNTYPQPRVLDVLRVENAVQGPGTTAQRDAEIPRLGLYSDVDGDGVFDGPGVDTLLASATLIDGHASFSGFALPVPSGEVRRWFVAAGVALRDAADGDRLAVQVPGALDLGFETPATVVGAWPVASADPPVVDGMVAGQVGAPVVGAATLGPGDGPVLALELIVPRNGYRDDVLNGLRLVNAGTAASTDLAELRLWRDGSDGQFDAGAGDDTDLGPLAWIGGEWRSPLLGEALGASGARLFVGATVAAAPGDSVTLRLRVPLDGIATASGNDGPRDAAIENPDGVLLSTAPLLTTVAITPIASAVGQVLGVGFTVRNVSAERIVSITPTLVGAEGTGSVSTTGPALPASFDLDPGAKATFTWPALAGAAGEVRLTGLAQGTGEPSGLPRRSLVSRSGIHRIFVGASDVSMYAVQSMPFAVDRGQSGVVPLSLTFDHPGAADASAIRVDRVVLELERQSGAGIVPSQLLSRLALREGATLYAERTSLEAAGRTVTLDLARPIVVAPGNPVTVSVELDIAAATTETEFRVVIPDSTGFAASDANSGGPVVVRLLGASYPVRSGLARVINGTRELWLGGPGAAPRRVTRGQPSIPLGSLRVRNLADPASGADIRVGSVLVDPVDSNGVRRPDLASAVARIVVRSPLGVHLDRAVTAADSSGLRLELGNLLTVPAGSDFALELVGDVRADAVVGTFGFCLHDSSAIETRDANSGEPVPVRFESTPLVAGSLVVESPPAFAAVSGRPEFPAAVSVGRAGLRAMSVVVRHPGSPGTARVRLDSLVVELLDAGRQRLAPATCLDRVAVLRRGVPQAIVFALPNVPSAFAVPLGGLQVEAGMAETLAVEVDIDPAAPLGSIELVVRDAGVRIADANSGAAVAIAADAGAVLPLSSGVMRLDVPSRRLAAGFSSRIAPVLPPDGSQAPIATLRLSNDAPAGSGSIEVDSLRIVAADADGNAIPIGSVAEHLLVRAAGATWAVGPALSPNDVAAVLRGSASLRVPANGGADVELLMAARAGPAGTRFRVGLDRGDIGVVQPQSSLLTVAVEAAPGNQFPFWTELSSVAERSLGASYSNYPNPFAAGREPTTFVYMLERASRVSLRIRTLRGELVRTLLDGVAVGAGLRQADLWDGRNGEGQVVVNGVYVAELLVEPAGGAAERVLRKVAVVR